MMTTTRRIGNDTEIDRKLNDDVKLYARCGYVEVGKDNYCLPAYYETYEEKIRTFEIRDDDVFVCGHPKSGTTWVQEMVWLIANNFDYENAAKLDILKRFPLLEFPVIFGGFEMKDLNSFEFLTQLKSPRCYKSHLTWSLLPEQICNGLKKPKIIIVLRNAEDTFVSYYYYAQTIAGYQKTLEDFSELFLTGRVCYGPFWKLVLGYWNERYRSNVLFVKYEDMKNNLPKVIKTVTSFLGKTITNQQISELVNHLSFDSMKNNPTVNKEDMIKSAKEAGLSTADNVFMRSGKVGGYKSEMSPEIIKKFQVWTKSNLEGTGLVM